MILRCRLLNICKTCQTRNCPNELLNRLMYMQPNAGLYYQCGFRFGDTGICWSLHPTSVRCRFLVHTWRCHGDKCLKVQVMNGDSSNTQIYTPTYTKHTHRHKHTHRWTHCLTESHTQKYIFSPSRFLFLLTIFSSSRMWKEGKWSGVDSSWVKICNAYLW